MARGYQKRMVVGDKKSRDKRCVSCGLVETTDCDVFVQPLEEAEYYKEIGADVDSAADEIHEDFNWSGDSDNNSDDDEDDNAGTDQEVLPPDEASDHSHSPDQIKESLSHNYSIEESAPSSVESFDSIEESSVLSFSCS